MSGLQLTLPITDLHHRKTQCELLLELLNGDLNFHDQDNRYATHNLHSFPAKFPPQLPRKFILNLTDEGDYVLDPMMGSGTTVLEALLADRRGLGFDIDPLSLLISKVKLSPLDTKQLVTMGDRILSDAENVLSFNPGYLHEILKTRWDNETKQFIDYWFTPETQLELIALLLNIETISDLYYRLFFEVAFSAIIITKTGGVSLALDLAHTRPHRAKIVSRNGEIISGRERLNQANNRQDYLIKHLRSPFIEFEKRYKNNSKDILLRVPERNNPFTTFGDAQRLPLPESSIDLIVTSPPYASNAIDYMRAHKFSLVWLGYPLGGLSRKRSEYIGGESTTEYQFEILPSFTTNLVNEITNLDNKKGQVLRRYYSEMTRVLREMYRVLKPEKTSIVVVGSSMIRGKNTYTQQSLAEIGRSIGFEVLGIGVRRLDRNRRMLPAGTKLNLKSQIQQRMHEEYVIGFIKPG